jgi:hypothetical protein
VASFAKPFAAVVQMVVGEARVDVVFKLPAEKVDMVVCETIQLEPCEDHQALDALIYDGEEGARVL